MATLSVNDLHAILTQSIEQGRGDSPVMVRVRLAHPTVGPVPMVGIESAADGFDWEHGKFVLHPARTLTPKD